MHKGHGANGKKERATVIETDRENMPEVEEVPNEDAEIEDVPQGPGDMFEEELNRSGPDSVGSES